MECTLDRYTDYLLATTKSATATGMSELFDGKISHDKVTRFLSESHFDGTTVWAKAKPLVRQFESATEGVLIADDSIVEKAHTDENAIICWHWDHSLGRNVKGVNFLSLLYHNQELSVPIDVHLVEKTKPTVHAETGVLSYKSEVTKNDILRQMLLLAQSHRVQWRHFLADSWFCSAETMTFIHDKLKKHYIMAIATSRTVALSLVERSNGQFHRVDSLDYPQDGRPLRVWLRSVKHTVSLQRQVFTNKDGSTGTLYLVSNDDTLDGQQITTIYKKRWNVEQYHKSVKQHAALAKSPTKTIETQANHLYASFIAYIKLQSITLKQGLNNFAIKSLVVAAATKAAFLLLQQLSA
jgi:hypothetical protein